MYEINEIIDTLICGDAYETLKEFPDECVDTICTSPPYFNLRREAPESDQEIGTEDTICDYLKDLYMVIQELHRVLKPTGSFFLNLGDSYGTGYGQPHSTKRKPSDTAYQYGKKPVKSESGRSYRKSLLGIPFRLLPILIDEGGWKLRNTIIWYKRNAMCDSAKDRYTNDFDYLFFLVKQNKYYFNQILEPYQTHYKNYDYHGQDVKDYKASKAQSPSESKRRILDSMQRRSGRNPRCVWDILARPHKGAHTSTFPEELVEKCLASGCPPDGTTLDPFAGSGTTCAVSKKRGLHWIGIDLSERNVEYARERLGNIL